MALIRFGIRHNLFYILMLIASIISRDIVSKIIEHFFEDKGKKNDNGILLTLIMFLAEFLFGLVLYRYQLKFLYKKNKIKDPTFMGIKLIQSTSKLSKPIDNNFIMYLLIISTSFFDFLEFILTAYYLPDIGKPFSDSLNIRIRSILAILSGLFCCFIFKYKIYKHQKCSLVVISICLFITIITEHIIISITKSSEKFKLNINMILILINHLFYSTLENTEKYLLEYDFINPFQMLMLQGFFGFIFTFIFLIIYKIKKPKFKIKYSISNKGFIIILIILLLLYFFFSGTRNSYRLLTNKLYSPATLALIYLTEDPINIIYYYLKESDFEGNIFYFIWSLILSIIILFSTLIYNEFLILFFCDLDHDTHYQISNRSSAESMTEIPIIDE